MAARKPATAHARVSPAIWILLLLATFLPRLLMARKLDTICSDGVQYLRVAEAIERGSLNLPLVDRVQIGLYPPILALLHRIGFEWETGIKFWGVLLSTWTVLPLFGWLRRQFDDRVAFVACLLYAVHPKLIEYSPEAVRDPTFWFFFTLSLYLLWRATEEVDWRHFLAAGVAMPLCALTRFEGWFLLAPFVGWTLLRFRWLEVGRGRLVAGAVLCVMTLPAVIFCYGKLLPPEAGWSYLRIEPLERAASWLGVELPLPASSLPAGTEPTSPAISPAPALADATVITAAIAATAQATIATDTHPEVATEGDATVEQLRGWSRGKQILQLFQTLERGLTPLFAICMFGGYLANFRRLNRADTFPILLIILAVIAGIWVHLSISHLSTSRYALSIALLTLSSVAMGVLEAARLVSVRFADRWPAGATFTKAVAASLLILGIVGWAEALSSDLRSRDALANLGRWIHIQFGDARSITGSESQLSLVGYYAHTHAEVMPMGLPPEELANWVTAAAPDILVLSPRRQTSKEIQSVLDQRAKLGFTLLDNTKIPGAPKKLLVLVRSSTLETSIQQATRLAVPGSATP
ncbi:MAG TPA: glycosyltransferase family 39 protein [Pirellulales bacterium]